MSSCDQHLDAFMNDTYGSEDLERIAQYLRERGTFMFKPTKSGLYPACPTRAEGSRYTYVWVRDNVHIAHALFRAGRVQEARAVAEALITLYEREAPRFEACISTPAFTLQQMERPHVRVSGDTLEELPEVWSHAQNDAHGAFLWLISLLVQGSVLTADERTRSVVARTLRFLTALPFYTDTDAGCWEEEVGVRASSVGIVCAGLQGWIRIEHPDLEDIQTHARELYTVGMQTLHTILPNEISGARKYDAALLLLIEPFNILTAPECVALLRTQLPRLMRPHGIVRYHGDTFWGPNFTTISEEHRTRLYSEEPLRHNHIDEGDEAQWTLFDPLLAAYYLKRHHSTHAESDAKTAAYHLNRTLRTLIRTGNGDLHLPELFFKQAGTFVPNTIVPLYWAEANLLYALTCFGRVS